MPSTPETHATRNSGHGVHIGVARWSYADWKGIVYPAPKPPGFSEMRYLAKHLDVIEINSTFYRGMPTAVANALPLLDTFGRTKPKAPEGLRHEFPFVMEQRENAP